MIHHLPRVINGFHVFTYISETGKHQAIIGMYEGTFPYLTNQYETLSEMMAEVDTVVRDFANQLKEA